MQKKNNGSGIVYSTNSNFIFESENNENTQVPKKEQKLHVKLDKKHRGGKLVTLIEGYRGNDIEEIGKALKKICGTGGSVKDGIIIIQGDNRDKVLAWLSKNDYKDVRKS